MKQATAGPPPVPVVEIGVRGFDPDVFPTHHAARKDAHTPPVSFDVAPCVVLSLLFSSHPTIMSTSPLFYRSLAFGEAVVQ